MRDVVLLSITAAINPTLVAASTLIMLIPSPRKLMLGYLRGALMTSLTIGIVIVLELPGASHLAGLHSIHELKYPTATTVLLVIAFNVVMLALLEIPLACFMVAPDWTPAAIERAKRWIGDRSQLLAYRGFGITGALLIIKGVIGLLT